MSPTLGQLTPMLLLGGGLGLSVWLLAVALYPPRPNLISAVRRWDRRPPARNHPMPGRTRATHATRAGAWLAREATSRGWITTGLHANLRLLDRSLEQHLITKALAGLTGFLTPSLLAAVAAAAGIRLPLLPTLAVALLTGGIGFVLPDLAVTERATARRSDLRRALGCYLDLVAMSLAGGRGVPEALPTAASVGSGWAFELLGRTVATARSTGSTPWAALADLGEQTGLPELQDLGSALSLVAHDGAKVRESLAARASTQRRRLLAEAEGDAKKANQSMSMAQIVLAAGFLLFLGYPAVINVLAI